MPFLQCQQTRELGAGCFWLTHNHFFLGGLSVGAVDYLEAGLTVDETCAAVARGVGWWDSAGAISTAAGNEALQKINEVVTAVGQAVTNWNGKKWWWAQDESDFQMFTATIAAAASTGAKRASNVVTIDIDGTGQHYVNKGQWVKIDGVDTSTFDGTFEVASIPDTATFTYAQAGSDVAASGSGTVHVFSYPLREVNIAGQYDSATGLMAEGWAVESICYDDKWYLRYLPWAKFRQKMRLLNTAGDPLYYSVHGEPPQLFFWSPPNATKDLHVNWIRRHSKIVSSAVDSATYSSDTALIIPAEFRWGTYVAGGEWLLKHETTDPSSLRECPVFMDTIAQMSAADPQQYDPSNTADMFPGTVGKYPHDRRVDIDGDQVLIYNEMSV